MYEELENLDIKLSGAEIQLFNDFIEFFLEYNSKVNLVSANDSKLIYEKHIYDSLSFNLFYTKYVKEDEDKDKINLLDIGTGGGFPAIPISLKYRNINVSAVDSINKKINFINMTAEHFRLNNIKGICKRVEELPKENYSYFDVITSRAMARLNIILEYAVPYLKNGGYFIAYKSIKADEEIKEAQNALKILNAKVIEKIEYSLPVDEKNKRFLIIVKKTGNTPNAYPRQKGLISKCPL